MSWLFQCRDLLVIVCKLSVLLFRLINVLWVVSCIRIQRTSFKAFNMAMLAKLGWRLTIKPKSFWGRFGKGFYFPQYGFHCSLRAWLSLLQVWKFFSKGFISEMTYWQSGLTSSEDFKIHSTRPPCSTEFVQDLIDQNSQVLEGKRNPWSCFPWRGWLNLENCWLVDGDVAPLLLLKHFLSHPLV